MRGWSQWRRAFIIVLILMGMCVSTALAEIYTWTDANGVQHFSDQPPASREAHVERWESGQFDEVEQAARQSPLAGATSEWSSLAGEERLPAMLLPEITGVY